MSEIIKPIKDKYDFYMVNRIDIDILFPFPPIDIIKNLPPSIYEYNPEYCKSWGGYTSGIFIHKNYIMDYLTSPANLIRDIDKTNLNRFLTENKLLNQEYFTVLSWELNKIPRKFVKNINLYFTCENLSDRTTWNKPIVHDTYKVICKYSGQCHECFQNLGKWNNGARWVFKNDTIYLE